MGAPSEPTTPERPPGPRPGEPPAKSSPLAVDAVVVDYCSGAVLARCVASLRAEPVRRVVVIDNSCSGASSAALRDALDVEVLESPRNGGFGAGANLGMARTSAPAVLVCNPDVELAPGALGAMLGRLAPDVGIVAPRLLDAGGAARAGLRPLPSFSGSALHAFVGLLAPRSRLATAYRRRRQALVADGRSCFVPGSCMLIARRAFESVGGFDESFFLYLEEVDLCRRLGEAGWRVLEEPTASVLHAGAASTSQHPVRAVLSYHASLWRYARKAASRTGRLALPAVALAIALRCALAVPLVLLRSTPELLAAPTGTAPARAATEPADRQPLSCEPPAATRSPQASEPGPAPG